MDNTASSTQQTTAVVPPAPVIKQQQPPVTMTPTPAAQPSVQSPPVTPPIPEPTTPVAPPATPVSAGNKEAGPVAVSSGGVEAPVPVDTTKDDAPVVAVSRPVEVELSKEVKDAGVEQGEDKPLEIAKEIADAGVTAGNDAGPLSTQTAAATNISMSYDTAVAERKKNGIRTGIRWLAEEMIYQLRKLNPKLPK